MALRIGAGALALVLLGSGVVAVCVSRSAAAPLTDEFTNQPGGWKAKVLFDSNGRPTSCGAGRLTNKDGVTLALVAGPNDEWAMALQLPAWQLEPEKSFDLAVTFDTRTKYRVFGKSPDTHTLMFRMPGDEFEEQFRKSKTMSVLFQGRNLNFDLAGTFRLLPALKDCVRNAGIRKSPGAAPVEARPDSASDGYGDENVDFRVLPQSALRKDVGNPTPLAIPGATTVTTMELKKAMDAGRPMILIDALQDSHQMTIKGAVSLRYAGAFGTFDDQIQIRLANDLTNLLQGRTEATLIFFCQGVRCWESYNAALRARAAGFQNVSWYRGGLRAWQAAGLPMQPSSNE
jgi:PQQ-dependent catabolism-associated CXXCW motif protein